MNNQCVSVVGLRNRYSALSNDLSKFVESQRVKSRSLRVGRRLLRGFDRLEVGFGNLQDAVYDDAYLESEPSRTGVKGGS
jgi:hypothetical protein